MENDQFKTCNASRHCYYGSMFPRDRVPLLHFINNNNGTLFKLCYDCRQYKSLHRTTQVEDKSGTYKCPQCRTLRTKDFCETCSSNNLMLAKKKVETHNRIIWERVTALRCCCERCKKTFLKKKDGSPGFVTIDNFVGVTEHDIEYRNLEFDHLTKEEQIERFDVYYGPKKKGVARIYSYESKKAESKKCMLLCLFCHKLKTSESRSKPKQLSSREESKIMYVNTKKCETGFCQICRLRVDPENLSYFEWDHIDPSKKRHEVSRIAKGTSAKFTLEYLVEEIERCRLSCTFCHRIHSGEQQKERFSVLREQKRETFTRNMSKKRERDVSLKITIKYVSKAAKEDEP